MGNNIAGKVVVITGASSGLGEATARHLSAKGATVVTHVDINVSSVAGHKVTPAGAVYAATKHAVAFAMSQPEDVDVNEILFRPTRQEL